MPGPDMEKAPPPKRAIGIVWLTVFVDLIGFSIIFPIFPAMLDWYLSRLEAGSALNGFINELISMTPGNNQEFLVTVLFGGLLGSLYSMLQFVASPVWGRLSDRHGRRPILLLTTAGTAVSYLVWIFSGSFWLLILSRIIAGTMSGNIAVATAAIADLTKFRNRAKGMALIGVAFGLGFILGPAIGGLGSLITLGSSFDYTGSIGITPFSFPALLAFILAVGNFLWVLKAFPETGSVAPGSEKKSPAKALFRFGSRIPDVRRVLKVHFLFIFAFSGMEFTLTFLALERLLYAPEDMSVMFLFIGLVLALTQGYVIRKYGHRFGERNFTTLGLLSGVVSMLFLSISHSTGLFYAGLALLGFGVGCASPSLSALVSLYAPSREQGAELGAFRSIGALGRAIGPLFGAAAFWSVGSSVAYIAGAGLHFVAAMFSLLLPEPVGIESAGPEDA